MWCQLTNLDTFKVFYRYSVFFAGGCQKRSHTITHRLTEEPDGNRCDASGVWGPHQCRIEGWFYAVTFGGATGLHFFLFTPPIHSFFTHYWTENGSWCRMRGCLLSDYVIFWLCKKQTTSRSSEELRKSIHCYGFNDIKIFLLVDVKVWLWSCRNIATQLHAKSIFKI